MATYEVTESTRARVRVRGLFPAAVKRKHLVEFSVILRK